MHCSEGLHSCLGTSCSVTLGVLQPLSQGEPSGTVIPPLLCKAEQILPVTQEGVFIRFSLDFFPLLSGYCKGPKANFCPAATV